MEMIGLEPRSCSKNQPQGLSAFSLFSFKNLKEPFSQSAENFFYEFLTRFLFFLRFRIRIIEFTEKFCYTSTVIFLMLLKM